MLQVLVVVVGQLPLKFVFDSDFLNSIRWTFENAYFSGVVQSAFNSFILDFFDSYELTKLRLVIS